MFSQNPWNKINQPVQIPEMEKPDFGYNQPLPPHLNPNPYPPPPTFSFKPHAPSFKAPSTPHLYDSDPLKKFNDSIDSIRESIKDSVRESIKDSKPIVQNFYFSDKHKEETVKTHASTFERKSVNPAKTLPSYVVDGNVCCDNCKLGELLHGFHLTGTNTRGEPFNHDLCAKCFNLQAGSLIKEHWVGFSISIQDNQ